MNTLHHSILEQWVQHTFQNIWDKNIVYLNEVNDTRGQLRVNIKYVDLHITVSKFCIKSYP